MRGQAFGTNIGSDLPTVPTEQRRPATSLLLSHNWIVSSKVTNEAKASMSWLDQDVTPVGSNWQASTFGLEFPEIFSGGRFPDGLPDITIADFKGRRKPTRRTKVGTSHPSAAREADAPYHRTSGTSIDGHHS